MKRDLTEALNDWQSSSNRKPLIIRGARQVGKTHILKEFGGAAFPRCHYVNFEADERPGRIFEPDLILLRHIINYDQISILIRYKAI